jgi:hypothetical protein
MRRDHWRHGIVFLNPGAKARPMAVEAGDSISFIAQHDDDVRICFYASPCTFLNISVLTPRTHFGVNMLRTGVVD